MKNWTTETRDERVYAKEKGRTAVYDRDDRPKMADRERSTSWNLQMGGKTADTGFLHKRPAGPITCKI